MKRTSRLLLLALALMTPQTTALAWGDTGHMVVAQIASLNLTNSARTRFSQLAGRVQLAETRYDFVTVSCWMDDLRSFPMFEPLKEWHFITRRFIVSGPAQDLPPPPVNIQSIIEWSIQKLADPQSSSNVRAYALASLIHLTGDVHQPLHCTTRYTTEHPDGDRGANLFPLTNALRDNLHSYWDAAAGLFINGDVRRPLNNSERQRIRQFAARIMAAHPSASIEHVDDLRPGSWVEESHGIARRDAYTGIDEGGTPDEDYESKARSICGLRIATAGYRLAAVLNGITTSP